jgi:hypothetical protein
MNQYVLPQHYIKLIPGITNFQLTPGNRQDDNINLRGTEDVNWVELA